MNSSDKSSEIVLTMSSKGGVGKTTTSAHLVEYLLLQGKRVAAIDTDTGNQGNLTAWLQLMPHGDELKIFRVFDLQKFLASIEAIAGDVDYVVIDSAGGFSEQASDAKNQLQRALLLICNRLIVPLNASALDTASTADFLGACSRLKQMDSNALFSAYTVICNAEASGNSVIQAERLMQGLGPVTGSTYLGSVSKRVDMRYWPGDGKTAFSARGASAKAIRGDYEHIFSHLLTEKEDKVVVI